MELSGVSGCQRYSQQWTHETLNEWPKLEKQFLTSEIRAVLEYKFTPCIAQLPKLTIMSAPTNMSAGPVANTGMLPAWTIKASCLSVSEGLEHVIAEMAAESHKTGVPRKSSICIVQISREHCVSPERNKHYLQVPR